MHFKGAAGGGGGLGTEDWGVPLASVLIPATSLA